MTPENLNLKIIEDKDSQYDLQYRIVNLYDTVNRIVNPGCNLEHDKYQTYILAWKLYN